MSFASSSTVWADFGFKIRVPAAIILAGTLYNSQLFYDSKKAHLSDSRFGSVSGTLLEIKKLQYRYITVPRYSVLYEYEVDGVKYTSRRATSGSPYRDWMGTYYTDTITEAQYLQSFPILRIDEPCTVLYDKKAPAAHASLAHDANSWETALLMYFGVFPMVTANLMINQYGYWAHRWGKSKTTVKFPQWAHVRPPRR
jgi:hypothetical protein